MKYLYLPVVLLLFIIQSVQAQTQEDYIDTVHAYLSTQSSVPYPLFKGDYRAWATEGRVVDLRIYDLKGPVNIIPTSFGMVGPPCPQYDGDNRRSSPPVDPNFADFSGLIYFIGTEVHKPGTAIFADFKAKDHGYYTRCLAGERVDYNQVAKIAIKLHSINLELDKEVLNIDVGSTANVGIKELYPKEMADVEWKSLNGVFVVTGDNNGATIEATREGNDVVVATYVVEEVEFRDSIKVNACKLQFVSEENTFMWYPGGNVNCNQYLSESSGNQEIKWELTGNANGASIDQEGMLTYPGSASNVTVQASVISNGVPVCNKSAVFVFAGFKVVLDREGKYCDGEQAPLHLEPTGTTDRSVLNELTEIELFSEPLAQFMGNIVNKKELEFAPVTADFKSRVANCYWYSTQDDHCNVIAPHKLKAKAKVKGKEVLSSENPKLEAGFFVPDCFEGKVDVVQTFTGKAEIRIVRQRRWYRAVFSVGTLKRDPRGEITVLKVEQNSQFRQILEAEEFYHLDQISGSKGTALSGLWNLQNIMNQLNRQTLISINRSRVEKGALALYESAVKAEIERSAKEMTKPAATACAFEREAKEAVNAKYRACFKCMYPDCK